MKIIMSSSVHLASRADSSFSNPYETHAQKVARFNEKY